KHYHHVNQNKFLRHTHKTWLIEDGVPEVVQCKRLGHRLGGVRGVYSHVTTSMVSSMCAGLQARWEQNGSSLGSDHYHTTSVVKIVCSQFAPTTQKRPVGDDHPQAV
ncbi:MAG: hypothetical protein ACJ73U_36215, partial [Actinophytocola sp.]